jgi:hypothetical protein
VAFFFCARPAAHPTPFFKGAHELASEGGVSNSKFRIQNFQSAMANEKSR